MNLLKASLRQFENGHNRPEVALIMEFEGGKTLFSIVGYDQYKTMLAHAGTPEDTLNTALRYLHAVQGQPDQPVMYDYDDAVPEDGLRTTEITLNNLRNEYVTLAEFTPDE